MLTMLAIEASFGNSYLAQFNDDDHELFNVLSILGNVYLRSHPLRKF